MDFDTAVVHLLKEEGGLVDHPGDPGGLTNYGISIRAYPKLGEDGIRNLTIDEVKRIYKLDYWDEVRCDELPHKLRMIMFDCAVNQGPGFSIKALQIALGVTADGILGPVTLMSARAVPSEDIISKYAYARFVRYNNNKNFELFKGGWMRRLLHITVLTLGE